MRKVLAFAVVATATLGIGFAGTTVKAAEPAQNIDISKMKVNWSDEFNGTELNSDHWTPEIGNGNWGWGNNEKEYYKANNISVSDGTMKIKAQTEKVGSYNWTSGRIKSAGKVNIGYGYVEAKVDKLHGNRIYLDFPSVGATENIMMAAILAPGITVIENAAEEPEIWDLARFLNSMGAKIEGAGYGKITIHGVSQLKQPEPFTPIFDRIEAGTFMVAAGITNSKITINGVNEEHLMPTIEKLKECGVYCSIDGQKMIVDGTQEKKPVDIKTMPYPGFPTDMQAQIMALLSITRGVSVITETVFENRFMHVGELGRMGANIKIDGRIAIVEGVSTLTGCEVKATDLRAGAAMILAGLVANGETEIGEVYHIDRGYTNIEEKFKKLGAEIYRIHK